MRFNMFTKASPGLIQVLGAFYGVREILEGCETGTKVSSPEGSPDCLLDAAIVHFG
jgi:hypothetical protein